MFRFGKKKRQPPQQQQQQQQQLQQQHFLPKVSQPPRTYSADSLDRDPNTSPSPSGVDLLPPQSSKDNQSTTPDREISRRSPVSSGVVKKAVKTYEDRSLSKSPAKRAGSSKESMPSSDRTSPFRSGRNIGSSSLEKQPSDHSMKRSSSHSLHSPVGTNAASVLKFISLETLRVEVGKEKVYEGVDLRLPPLQTSSVSHRTVVAVKNASLGGFGFVLRKSFQPDPENQDKPLLVHLVEPRPNYVGPLMTGDRIIEVNGENVENIPHERVVELIKASGDSVQMVVASVPELMELNVRGALDEEQTHHRCYLPSSGSGSKKNKQGAGTLRKRSAQKQTYGNSQV